MSGSGSPPNDRWPAKPLGRLLARVAVTLLIRFRTVNNRALRSFMGAERALPSGRSLKVAAAAKGLKTAVNLPEVSARILGELAIPDQ
jgi:hypothetical protein